jgi:hypothetical protein
MSVVPNASGSTVRVATEFTVAGRAATFGRGLMEDVSKRMVAQVADAIRQRLEAQPTAGGGVAVAVVSAPPAAKPVNAIGLLFSIFIERIRGWFRR